MVSGASLLVAVRAAPASLHDEVAGWALCRRPMGARRWFITTMGCEMHRICAHRVEIFKRHGFLLIIRGFVKVAVCNADVIE
jgi:hypothetical protein